MKRITWLLAAMVLLAGPALAATPKDTVVMAKQIDDIITLDPAESFEFSGSEIIGNIYERLIALRPEGRQQAQGRAGRELDGRRRRQDLHLQDEAGHQVRTRATR